MILSLHQTFILEWRLYPTEEGSMDQLGPLHRRFINRLPRREQDVRELPVSYGKYVVLQTGITPSASGSAYLELEPSNLSAVVSNSRRLYACGIKLICTVHGPKPLPRSTPFTPQLLLSARVKFAPFANSQRRAYIPESSERDLAAHLETTLRGILIGERWPKSGVDLVVTVLEGEEDFPGQTENWGIMTVLAGCITVASAAIADAGIDCVDLVTGGVAAAIPNQIVLDPCPSEHGDIRAACVVGYLQTRDEITELWSKQGQAGASGSLFEPLVDNAVEAAKAAKSVLLQVLEESVEQTVQLNDPNANQT